ncbi:MAG: hypothetical protein AAB737_01890 [Patescibacteria group bacterium]
MSPLSTNEKKDRPISTEIDETYTSSVVQLSSTSEESTFVNYSEVWANLVIRPYSFRVESLFD